MGVEPYTTWYADLPDGAPTIIRTDIPIYLNSAQGSPGPQTHLSGDGRWLFHVEQVPGLGVPAGSSLRLTDLDDPALAECPSPISTIGSLQLSRSHRSVSQDGDQVVIRASLGGNAGVHLLTRSAPCSYTSAQITADPSAVDPTMSADGSIVAWSSNRDSCDPAYPQLTSSDLWIWMLDGAMLTGMADSCTIQAGHPLEGTTLNRFPGASVVNDGDESLPSVSADGTAIAFLSDGSLVFGTDPPDLASQVWVARLGSTAVSLEQVTEWTEDPYYEGGVSHPIATSATITDGGETVAYAVADHVFARRELRLVNLEVGEGAGLAPESVSVVRPAALPFELNLLDCTATGTEVQFDIQLRQFRGGERQVVLQLEVEDGLGVTHRRAPIVQPLLDESAAIVIEGMESNLTAGTCRVTAHDGAVTSVDRVTDSLAFGP